VSENVPDRASRIWAAMQRFVLLGSVCGVAAGGVTATVQHSRDVVDVLSFIRVKIDPDVGAPPPEAATTPEPEVALAPVPPVPTFGPLRLVRLRAVDVTPVEDGGGLLRGDVEWDFTIRDALSGIALELEGRAYRANGAAESFGTERVFTQTLDNQVALLIDGWFHDRLGRRELRIRELVHLDLSAPPAPLRIRGLRGADWGLFDLRLERADTPQSGPEKQPS